MGEGWGSGCRIQQCPGTETGGHGLLGGHRAEGLGSGHEAERWAPAGMRLKTWAGSIGPEKALRQVGMSRPREGLALSLCAAEYQSLCPHGRGYLAPSGDPSQRRGEARL